MDNIINDVTDCGNVIYSDEYVDYIIDYRNEDEYGIDSFVVPCTQPIDGSFEVVYSHIDTFENVVTRSGFRTVPQCYGLLDAAVIQETGTYRLRRQPFFNLYGQGVIIGLVDCGIDFTNNAFIRADNTSRILSVWDQENRSGIPPQDFLYGTEYTREDIDRALNGVPVNDDIYGIIDENGHGSSMAAIAAGSEIEENDFSGMAPLADIAVVKLKKAKPFYMDLYMINREAYAFQENDVMMGIRYLIDISRRERKPLVICLGIGTNQGDHNGSGPLCEYLNSIASKTGYYVCAAAGNETGRRHHFRGMNTSAGDYKDVELLVSERIRGAGMRGFYMELWTDILSRCSVQIKPPIGEFSGIIDVRERKKRVFDFLLSGSRVEVYSELVEKSTGDQLVIFRVIDPAPGVWTVRVIQESSVPGVFDMWLPMEDFQQVETVYIEADPNVIICEPANALNIMTFAASNADGSRIYVNSSRGYTRDGRIKPDLTAPGENINVNIGTATGTSIAAAVGAGIVALFAEWSIPDQPTNSIAAKKYLISGARTDNLEVPNRSWGWGRIDIYNTFVNLFI